MHDRVYAKCERVIVRWRDGCSCSSADVCEDYLAGSVAAYGSKVGVVKRRLDCLVESRVQRGPLGVGFVEIRRKGREDAGVPCHAEAINVEEAVTSCDFGFGRGLSMYGGVVGEEFGEVVLVDLLAESMCWGCKVLEDVLWSRRSSGTY